MWFRVARCTQHLHCFLNCGTVSKYHHHNGLCICIKNPSAVLNCTSVWRRFSLTTSPAEEDTGCVRDFQVVLPPFTALTVHVWVWSDLMCVCSSHTWWGCGKDHRTGLQIHWPPAWPCRARIPLLLWPPEQMILTASVAAFEVPRHGRQTQPSAQWPVWLGMGIVQVYSYPARGRPAPLGEGLGQY